MQEWLKVILLTSLAGLAMPLGASLASIFHLKPKWIENEARHTILAFGGGALLSAVALVLVPEGSEHLGILSLASSFLLGGVVFMYVDKKLKKADTPAANLMAMLTDFIPEALALGTSCAKGSPSGVLLAFLIFIQNVPEGFNTYKEMIESKRFNKTKIISILITLSVLGPMAGLAGFYLLSQMEVITSWIMIFASGGILYIIFKDVAPQADLKEHWAPPLGAVMGFLLGLLGHQLI